MQRKQSFSEQVLISSVWMTHPLRLAENGAGRRSRGKNINKWVFHHRASRGGKGTQHVPSASLGDSAAPRAFSDWRAGVFLL